MEYLKSNYDRVLLVVAALLALVFGTLLTMKALALPKKYARAEGKERSELGDNGVEAVKAASAHLSQSPPPTWELSEMPGVPQKKLPLMVSVPIWVKKVAGAEKGIEIDLLDPSSPRIRNGLDNAWAHQHGLDVGRNDIESLDGDNDGFTNLEEFEGQKTDPNDPESHPPFTDKLVLAEVRKDLYILTYRTGERADGEFGLREETERFQRDPPLTPLRRKSYFLNMGDEFGAHPGGLTPDGKPRFKLSAFEERKVPGGAGGAPRAAHIITIEVDGGESAALKLEYREPYIVTTPYAVFHYSLPGHETLLGPFKEGDTFKLPNDDGTTYELLEVTPDLAAGAGIRKLGAAPKDIRIPAGVAPQPAPEAVEDPVVPDPAVPDPAPLTPAPAPAPVEPAPAPGAAPEAVPPAG